MAMLAPDLPSPVSPARVQTFSVIRQRPTSISTSHLSPKPIESTENTIDAMSALLNIPTDPIQLDIPIRKVNDGDPTNTRTPPGLTFDDLPVEVHGCILDWLFGVRASTSSTSTPGKSSAVRGWSNVLRHPRRKALSDLALVSPTWRPLVQERLFRHIKIKGTQDGLHDVEAFFKNRPHFRDYVKHVDVWIPVWGNRAIQSPPLDPSPLRPAFAAVVDGSNASYDATNTGNVTYSLASHNASLEEIFEVAKTFTQARILTVEGGHCKKPPMARHFKWRGGYRPMELPKNENITTLVIRGAWNIMRDVNHYADIIRAFPNVREWHCAYAKPKLEAYQTIFKALPLLPNRLTHLNLCVDGFYNKAPSPVNQYLTDIHICSQLGKIAPRLEALSFTGRVCGALFTSMRKHIPLSGSRLRSLDLNVKNCCRSITRIVPPSTLDPLQNYDHSQPQPTTTILTHDGPAGITNYTFIIAFESLVHSSIQALPILPTLSFIRIRFIDLDSACPLLNPYFQLKNNECTGLWSDQILSTLSEVKPEASFVSLDEGIEFGKNSDDSLDRRTYGVAGGLGGDGDGDGNGIGVILPRSRPTAMKSIAFKGLAEGLKGNL